MTILKTLKFIYQYLLNIWSGSLIYEHRNLPYPPQIVDGKLTFANQDELSLSIEEMEIVDAEFHVAMRFLKMRYSFYVIKNPNESRFDVEIAFGKRHHCALTNSTLHVHIDNPSNERIIIPAGTYLFQIEMNNPNWLPRIYSSIDPKDFAL